MMRTTPILLILLVAAFAFIGCGNSPTTDALVRRAVRNLQAGRIDPAKVSLRQALDQSPSDPAALYYMGRICHAEKRYEQAAYYYRCCLDADPSFALAQKYLAEAQKHLRNDLSS